MEVAPRRTTARISDAFYKYGLYVVFAVLLGTFTALNPIFISIENIVNLLQQSSAASVAAVGIVFVMVAGGLDLSIGSIINTMPAPPPY